MSSSASCHLEVMLQLYSKSSLAVSSNAGLASSSASQSSLDELMERTLECQSCHKWNSGPCKEKICSR